MSFRGVVRRRFYTTFGVTSELSRQIGESTDYYLYLGLNANLQTFKFSNR